MPTPSGRETTTEREQRQRSEKFAAIRAAITPAMRDETRDAPPDTEYPAGERVELVAGRRRIAVDEGEIRRLALADALTARGYEVIGHGLSFGLYAGRSTVRYSVTVRRP